ncbi:MAG: hypothetical protein VW124_23220, partial [Paracoccaceae bacterium]
MARRGVGSSGNVDRPIRNLFGGYGGWGAKKVCRDIHFIYCYPSNSGCVFVVAVISAAAATAVVIV